MKRMIVCILCIAHAAIGFSPATVVRSADRYRHLQIRIGQLARKNALLHERQHNQEQRIQKLTKRQCVSWSWVVLCVLLTFDWEFKSQLKNKLN